jgi:hypothetical protein
MRSIFLQPNSPRGRIEYVAKSMPNVAYDTAYVVAHTVGADRDAIILARRSGAQLPVEVFSADKPHPSEALIGWVAQQLAAGQRAVRKQQSTPELYNGLVFTLEAKLPQIAVWVENTKPNLGTVSVAQAVAEASAFKPPESTAPVPQGEVIYRFADGWTVQNLTTREQIFADGIHVQNCLREDRYGPRYARAVKKGTTQILSLRSPHGIPRVSIEYDLKNKYFKQVYAKQNTALGATLESLKSDDVQGAEELWAAIQKYKPRIQELILQKFNGDESGLLLIDVPLPDDTKKIQEVNFEVYTCRLPESVQEIGLIMYLEKYKYPLPSSLKQITDVTLKEEYRYPLPESLKSVRNMLIVDYSLPVHGFSVESLTVFAYYQFPLDGIINVTKRLVFEPVTDRASERTSARRARLLAARLRKRSRLDQSEWVKYQWPIPQHVKLETLSMLSLDGYNYPLPANLKRLKGVLQLGSYDFMLPASLKSVGDLILNGYSHPLPPSLSEVKRRVELVGYPIEFPEHLKRAGLVSVVSEDLEDCPYPFPVPSGFQMDTDFTRQQNTIVPEKRGGKRSSKRKGESGHPSAVGIAGIEEILSNRPIEEGVEVIGLSGEEMSYAMSQSEEVDLADMVPRFSLVGYSHPLPSTLKRINADLNLYGYDYPLPSSLKKINGELQVNCYNHSLPRGLEADTLIVARYGRSLPLALIRNASSVILTSEAPKLPAGIRAIKGDLVLQRYNHPLPSDIVIIGGSLYASNSGAPLPANLKNIGSHFRLSYLSAPLPESIESVGGSITLDGYTHRLPESLKFVGGGISLSEYEQPLPPGLLPEKGYDDTEGYPHPIPGQTPELKPNRVTRRPRSSRRPVRRMSRTSRLPARRTSRGWKTSRSRSLRRKTSKR